MYLRVKLRRNHLAFGLLPIEVAQFRYGPLRVRIAPVPLIGMLLSGIAKEFGQHGPVVLGITT